MNGKELAAKAADEIDARGWARVNEVEADGRVCVLGACAAVYFGDPQRAYGYEGDGNTKVGPYHSALREIAAGLGLPGNEDAAVTLYTWNDTAGRERHEVTTALRQFAGAAS